MCCNICLVHKSYVYVSCSKVGLPLPIIFQWHVTCHFGNAILSRTRNDRDTDTIRQRSCLFIFGQSTDLEFFWRYLAWFGGRGRGRLCRRPRPFTRGAEAGGQYEKLQPVSPCCWLQLLEMYLNWSVCFLWLVLQYAAGNSSVDSGSTVQLELWFWRCFPMFLQPRAGWFGDRASKRTGCVSIPMPGSSCGSTFGSLGAQMVWRERTTVNVGSHRNNLQTWPLQVPSNTWQIDSIWWTFRNISVQLLIQPFFGPGREAEAALWQKTGNRL